MDESPDQPWVRAYRNNKGAVLILCAEAVATSMDAIVRWLQQGEKSMHPYQVWNVNNHDSIASANPVRSSSREWAGPSS